METLNMNLLRPVTGNVEKVNKDELAAKVKSKEEAEAKAKALADAKAKLAAAEAELAALNATATTVETAAEKVDAAKSTEEIKAVVAETLTSLLGGVLPKADADAEPKVPGKVSRAGDAVLAIGSNYTKKTCAWFDRISSRGVEELEKLAAKSSK